MKNLTGRLTRALEPSGCPALFRESLYKALSGERTPSFDTILKVVSALGWKLRAEAAQH